MTDSVLRMDKDDNLLMMTGRQLGKTSAVSEALKARHDEIKNDPNLRTGVKQIDALLEQGVPYDVALDRALDDASTFLRKYSFDNIPRGGFRKDEMIIIGGGTRCHDYNRMRLALESISPDDHRPVMMIVDSYSDTIPDPLPRLCNVHFE